jgi:hypothetical protein
MWRHVHGIQCGLRILLEIPDSLGDPGELQLRLLPALGVVAGGGEIGLDQVVSATGSGFE